MSSSSLVLFNKSKKELSKELKELKYAALLPSSRQGTEQEEGNYDYLLNMRLTSLSSENVYEVEQHLESLKQEIALLEVHLHT